MRLKTIRFKSNKSFSSMYMDYLVDKDELYNQMLLDLSSGVKNIYHSLIDNPEYIAHKHLYDENIRELVKEVILDIYHLSVHMMFRYDIYMRHR